MHRHACKKLTFPDAVRDCVRRCMLWSTDMWRRTSQQSGRTGCADNEHVAREQCGARDVQDHLDDADHASCRRPLPVHSAFYRARAHARSRRRRRPVAFTAWKGPAVHSGPRGTRCTVAQYLPAVAACRQRRQAQRPHSQVRPPCSSRRGSARSEEPSCIVRTECNRHRCS